MGQGVMVRKRGMVYIPLLKLDHCFSGAVLVFYLINILLVGLFRWPIITFLLSNLVELVLEFFILVPYLL